MSDATSASSRIIYLVRDFLHDKEGERYSDELIFEYLTLGITNLKQRVDIGNERLKFHYPTIDDPIIYLPKGEITLITLNGCKVDVSSPSEISQDGLILDSFDNTITAHDLDTNEDVITIPSNKDGSNLAFPLGALPDLSDMHLSIPLPRTLIGFVYFNDDTSSYFNEIVVTMTRDVDSSSELTIEDKYILLLKHFICGHLLRDDRESQSSALGIEELNLYYSELDKIIKLDKEVNKEYVYTKKPIVIPYGGTI